MARFLVKISMRKILLISLAFHISRQLTAQAPLFFHFSGHGAFPLNHLKESGYENGGGIQMMVLSGALNPKGQTAPWEKGLKLQAGAGLELNSFGNRSFNIEIADPAGTTGTQKITNTSGAFYGVLRASYTPTPLLNPFVEGIIGGRNYTSQEQLSANGTSQSTDTFSTRTFTAGIGLGIAIKITNQFFVEAKTTWCLGSNGTYQPLRKITQPQNQVFYQPQTSQTDLLLTQIGIIWRLGGGKGCCLGNSGRTNGSQGSGSYSNPSYKYTPSRKTPAPSNPPPSQKKIIVKPDPPKTKPRG